MFGRIKRFFSKIRQYYIEVRTVKKIYQFSSGKEVTEKENGCHIDGFLLSPPETRKIIPIGGTGSQGTVIPPEMLAKINTTHFKIYLIEDFGSEPIIVLTSTKKMFSVGGNKI